MPSLIFSHPDVDGYPDPTTGKNLGPLELETGVNSIFWGYNLNVQRYPTYGGEVVQILSAYVDDVVLAGEVRHDEELMHIYRYFYAYFTLASQGQGSGAIGDQRFNQKPMTLEYQHRQWLLHIQPIAAPGFRIGRDVVVPTWQLTAHVVQDWGDAPNVGEFLKQTVESIPKDSDEEGSQTWELVGEVGYIEDNPFSDPSPGTDTFDPAKVQEGLKALDPSGMYNDIIKAYTEGKFDSLTAGAVSKPGFMTAGGSKQEKPKANTTGGAQPPSGKGPSGQTRPG